MFLESTEHKQDATILRPSLWWGQLQNQNCGTPCGNPHCSMEQLPENVHPAKKHPWGLWVGHCPQELAGLNILVVVLRPKHQGHPLWASKLQVVVVLEFVAPSPGQDTSPMAATKVRGPIGPISPDHFSYSVLPLTIV